MSTDAISPLQHWNLFPSGRIFETIDGGVPTCLYTGQPLRAGPSFAPIAFGDAFSAFRE
jgi:hypothetical protein